MALSPLLLGKKCFKLFLRGSPCPVRLPGRTVVKNPLANAGDIADSGSIHGSGRSPGEGHGNPLQYSHLENPMDRGAWRASVREVMTEATQPAACTLLEHS